MKTWNQKPLLTIWIVKRTTVTEWLHLKPVQPSGGAIFSLHPWFGKPGPKTISHSPFITFPSPRPILLRFLWLQPRTLVVLTVRLDLSWSKAKVKLRFRMTKIITWQNSSFDPPSWKLPTRPWERGWFDGSLILYFRRNVPFIRKVRVLFKVAEHSFSGGQRWLAWPQVF